MYNLKQRILGAVLTLSLLLSIIPAQAFADPTTPPTIITVTIQYIKDDADQTVVADPYIASVPQGYTETKRVASPAVAGYTPERDGVDLDFSTFQSDTLIKVVYHPNPVTYTVRHMTEDLDGNLTEAQVTTQEGPVGTLAVAKPVALEGFTATTPLPNAVIPQDKPLELTIVYKRNHYQLTYDTADGTYIAGSRVYYGQPLTLPEDPTRNGYSFAGWESELPATMPARDVVMRATWSENEQTPYYMNVYVQDVKDLTSYTYVGNTKRYGKTGDNVTLPTKLSEFPQTDYPDLPQEYVEKGWSALAFTINGTKTMPELNKTIKGDGSTVLNVYMDRKTYKVIVGNNPSSYNNKYAWYPRFELDGVVYDRDNPYSFTIRFGEPMKPYLPARDSINNLNPGYSIMENLLFVGKPVGTTHSFFWISDPEAVFSYRALLVGDWQNIEDTRWVSLERQNNKQLYNLTVHNWVQPVHPADDNDYVEEAPYYRTYEYTANQYTAPQRAGFTTVNSSNPGENHSISSYKFIYTGTGPHSDSYVNVYYKRNSYPVRLYWDTKNAELTNENAANPVSNTYFDTPLRELTALSDTADKRPDTVSEDFTFAGWYYDSEFTRPVDLSRDTMPASQLDLFAKWAPARDVLNITFDPSNGTPAYTTPVSYGGKVTQPEVPVRPGYTFVGWKEVTTTRSALPELFDFERRVTKDLNLRAVWEENSTSSLTINHIQENGQPTTETIEGLAVGSTYTATARTIDGYLPHTLHQSIIVKPNPADNQITFTYRPFTTVNYEIRYEQQLPDGTTKTLAPAETITTNKNIDTKDYREIAGYVPLTLQRTLQMSANEADNVMTFLYRDAQESSYKLEVYFDDGNGQLRQDDTLTEIVSAHIGADVVYNARLTIDNYQLDPTRSQLSGRVTSDQLVLKAVYVLGLERPIVDPIEEGDSSIKVGQPDAADKVIITVPDPAGNGATHTITINKQTDGTWKTDPGVEVPVLEGKLIVPVDPAWMVPGAVIEVVLGKDGLLSDPTQVVVQAKQQTAATPQNNAPSKKLPKAGDVSWIAPVVAAFAAAGMTLGAVRIRSKKRD